jgi:excisionase family DNA binding protein
MKMLKEQEAADRLGLSVKTLRQWRWAGKGPRFKKFGSAVRYSEADLAAYIESAARDNTSQVGEVVSIGRS